METEKHSSPGIYPTTIWSEVRRGGMADPSLALPALDDLLRRYRQPLLDHLRFKFRATPETAEDWLQSFFLEKVVLRRLLMRANRLRGRFRTFLLRALTNFVVSEQRKERAHRRRPKQGWVPLDELTPAEAGRLIHEATDRFAVEWARALLQQALARMEAECAARGRPERWAVFQRCLLAPLLEGVAPPPYAQLVAEFGFRSPSEVAQVRFRGREMYERILREVVAEYAEDPAGIEQELCSLRRALSGT